MLTVKKFASNYFGFVIGTFFGAFIATLVSYLIFSISLGQLDDSRFSSLQECLLERLNE